MLAGAFRAGGAALAAANPFGSAGPRVNLGLYLEIANAECVCRRRDCYSRPM